MDIVLSPEQQAFVDVLVHSGRFESAEQVIVYALDAVRELDQAEDTEWLREQIAVGIAEADRGEFVEFTAEDIIAERRAARQAKLGG